MLPSIFRTKGAIGRSLILCALVGGDRGYVVDRLVVVALLWGFRTGSTVGGSLADKALKVRFRTKKVIAPYRG